MSESMGALQGYVGFWVLQSREERAWKSLGRQNFSPCGPERAETLSSFSGLLLRSLDPVTIMVLHSK